jgi:CIC family chloride channel protein
MIKRWFETFLNWRARHIPHRHFILALAALIGVVSGLAAVLLKNTAHYTHYYLTTGFDVSQVNFLYLLYPLFGIALTVAFVYFFIKEDITHGVSRVLQAISQKEGRMERHDSYSSMVASTITVSFGGSVGLEAPVMSTGSALGSAIGQLFRMEPRVLVLCIGCGTAGAVSAIFKAPIAGVVFALEVLMLDLTMASLLPLLISAITGAVVAAVLMGKDVLFAYDLTEPFYLKTLPFFLVLGLLSGLFSLYFTKTNMFIENLFNKVFNPWKRFIIGGLLVSLLVFLFPPLFGEGYDALKAILAGNGDKLLNESVFYGIPMGWLFLFFILGLILLKVIAMAITTGSGGVGGVFAPSLFVGGLGGFFLARAVNLSGIMYLPEPHFALAGMAGLMAGVMHTPLTAIFLIAEISGGYELLLPLAVTAAGSYLTHALWEPHSVYTKRLAEKGQLISRNKDKVVLQQMKIDELIEKNFLHVHYNDYLGDLVRQVSRSERNIFPVIDREQNFYGMIFINDVRHIMFKQEMYGKVLVKDLMYMPEVSIEIGESMENVARKFNDTDKYNIVVLDKGKYIGFVSRANFFSTYRQKLKESSEE